MTKQELILKVSEETGLSKKEASAAVEEVFANITEALKAGDRVSIPHFGQFEVKRREARTGINPLTKEPVEIAAKNVPFFKASSVLKNAVDGK